MSADSEKLNLVLNVHHAAGNLAAFSDAVTYAFHVNSAAGFGQEQTQTRIVCQFYALDRLECWAGEEYVEGNASDENGVESSTGKLKTAVVSEIQNVYRSRLGSQSSVPGQLDGPLPDPRAPRSRNDGSLRRGARAGQAPWCGGPRALRERRTGGR